MKPITLFLLPLLPAFFMMLPKAEASSLLAPSCVALEELQSFALQDSLSDDRGEMILSLVNTDLMMAAQKSNRMGLTCQDIRKIDQTAKIIALSISPAVTAFMSPVVRSALAAELATLGVVAGTPVVMGATVIGGFGIVTYKILMMVSLEQCAQQDREALKQELFHELESRYGLSPSAQTTLQINK